MSSTTAKVLLLLALIVLNGVFAMSELAVVSSKKARLRKRADEGSLGARAALALAESPNRFLATVQVGISLVGIFAGAYGGAQLAGPLALALDRVPALRPYSGGLSVGLVVAAITYLSLIIGELVPKRIALNNPERIAAAIARPMQLVSVAATPIVWLLSKSTETLFKLLRLRGSEGASATEEEIGFLLHEGTEAGVIHSEEQRIVERVFRFGDRDIGAVMTPRRDVAFVDLTDSEAEIRAQVSAALHSRLVVCEGGLDHVRGVVDVRGLLAGVLAGEALDVAGAVRAVQFVPEHAPALRVLELFRASGEKVAVVIDEYGAMVGFVSLDDVLEALVGALPGAGAATGIETRDDGTFLVGGSVSVDDLAEETGIELPADEREDYRTVAGWLVARTGNIPDIGTRVEAGGLRVEVVAMDGPRVETLALTVLATTRVAKEPV